MTDDFRAAHATAPAWRDAAAAILVELGDLTTQHQLGFLYVTDSFADALDEIVDFLRETTGCVNGSEPLALASLALAKNILTSLPCPSWWRRLRMRLFGYSPTPKAIWRYSAKHMRIGSPRQIHR